MSKALKELIALTTKYLGPIFPEVFDSCVFLGP